MAPTLLPGDRLLVVPAGRPRVGDMVTVPDPRRAERLLVKRVVSVDPSGSTVMVAGDNADASTGSAEFGSIPWGTVLGRASYRYFPPERAGRIRRIRRWPHPLSPPKTSKTSKTIETSETSATSATRQTDPTEGSDRRRR